MEMKSCWYKAVVGVDPNKADCERLHPNGCYNCTYFMPDPPEPKDKNELDDLPQFD